jgi:20S proteasome alpha/beta subunit
MTIAAGFVATDGILLCADTLYTDGVTKFHGEKIFPWAKNGAVVCFAVSGSATIAKMAVDDCKAALNQLNSEQCSPSGIFDTIRIVVKYVQEQYVDSRPIEDRENSRFYMLVAIHAQSEPARLYSSSDAAMAPVNTYDCIGAGRQLGLYIIEPSYAREMTVDELTILASHALAAAKERVDGVGGRSQFWTIRDGTVSEVEPYDYDRAETQVLEYRQKAASLLSWIGDKNLTDKDFKGKLDWFTEEALALRATWKGGAAPWEYLTQRLARYRQAGQQDPQSTTTEPSLQPPSQE